jgi:hypothetical protein
MSARPLRPQRRRGKNGSGAVVAPAVPQPRETTRGTDAHSTEYRVGLLQSAQGSRFEEGNPRAADFQIRIRPAILQTHLEIGPFDERQRFFQEKAAGCQSVAFALSNIYHGNKRRSPGIAHLVCRPRPVDSGATRRCRVDKDRRCRTPKWLWPSVRARPQAAPSPDVSPVRAIPRLSRGATPTNAPPGARDRGRGRRSSRLRI